MIQISVLFVVMVAVAPGPKEPVGKKGNGLEGKWQLVEIEEKGRAAEKPDEPQTLMVKGGEMVFQRGEDVGRVLFTIDATKSPAQLDLKVGPTGGVCHLIVRVEKDELVICSGTNMRPDEPADRPKEFLTGPPEDRPQKGKLLYRYKRVKD